MTRLLLVLLVVAHSPRLWADSRYGLDPDAGGFTRSLGFPHLWHLESGLAGGLAVSSPHDGVGELRLRISRDMLFPVVSLLALTFEGAGGVRGTDWMASGRLMVTSLGLRFGVGVDCDFRTRTFSPIVSLIHPIRRGGIIGASSLLRFDWIPGESNTLLLGLQFPLERAGELGPPRPVEDTTPLPGEPRRPVPIPVHSHELVAMVDELRERAHWIYRLTVPYLGFYSGTREEELKRVDRQLAALAGHLDATGGDASESAPAREQRAFHALLDRAFSLAATGAPETTELGRALARQARTELLRGVLLPYDQRLGQLKEPDTVLGLGELAAGRFLMAAVTKEQQQGPALAELTWLFDQLVRTVESVREEAHRDFDDSRMSWLPLQLALLPEDCRTKEQLDSLVESLVEEHFTDDNRLQYVANQRFQEELEASVAAASEYHVLWIHDIAGKNPRGDLDATTFSDVVDVYLPALTRKIEAYDTTGTLPVYMIFLDQWYYEATDGRRWLRVLEDPLDPTPPLPHGYDEWKRRLAEARGRLANAIAHSQLLQSQAALHGGEWLKNRVKVHVSITNRAAPSYFRWGWLPWAGFPDDTMRDHRKIIFYDVSEHAPYRGTAVFAGMGVGEQYQRPKWEDRALAVQGPALFQLRRSARELLRRQGVVEEEIPWALREETDGLEKQANPAIPEIAPGERARVLQAQNETGYGLKRATVLKAAMYTLLPPGTVDVVPDSLWTNPLWAGMLIGHALRGGRVLVVLPGPRGAPSNGFAQLAQMQDLATRLLAAATGLAPQISAAHGLLRVGVFAPENDVLDEPALIATQRENLEKEAFLRELLGFGDDVLGAFRAGEERSRAALATMPRPGADGGSQLLHLKVNAFVLPDEWSALTARPEWARLFGLQFEERLGTLRELADGARTGRAAAADAFEAEAAPLAAQMLGPDPQHAGLWVVAGSQNMDLRAMLLDGEVMLATTGAQDVLALLDLMRVLLECRWVETRGELDAVFPPYPQWQRDVAHLMRIIL